MKWRLLLQLASFETHAAFVELLTVTFSAVIITNCLSYCCLLNGILILGFHSASKEIPQEEELLGDRISLIEQVEFQCRARGLLGRQPNA